MNGLGPDEPTTAHSALEANLRLIPWHMAFTYGFAWIPVFVLFTRARFGLDGAVLLAGLYYLFVVVLEVPSGWMSDRLGRVLTLRVAAVGFVAAHLCFTLGGSFAIILLGQWCLAVGFSSLSGTDISFHYDTLESLERHTNFTADRARVTTIGLISGAGSALMGGLLGLINLRLAFAASLLLAAAQLVLAFRLSEPPSITRADPLGRQLRRCLGHLRDRYLGWIFLYGIAMVTLEHLAFTMMQPWLTEVLGATADKVESTPGLAGGLFAATSLVGAVAVRTVPRLDRRVGTPAALIGLAVLSAVIVSGMAWSTHWVVVPLVVLRSVQGAAGPVLIGAAVAPRVPREQRATVLSLNSLAGRMGYGVVLVLVSLMGSSQSGASYESVALVLQWFTVLAWVLVGLLVLSALIGRQGWRTERVPTSTA